ncbi:MAG: 5'/3'-nucleotidase SurE [Anaerolineales bacterium]
MSNNSSEPLIVLTNDDGVASPGILAAARALAPLGWIVVSAPREQQSGSGRSMPYSYGGIIQSLQRAIGDDHWEFYSVDGTPAQCVQHAMLELTDRRPDLVVSGINYGENVGGGTTISGTVGAALEAASFDVPALAVSLETDHEHHLTHSEEVDFTAAGHFTYLFAQRMLTMPMPDDVDVLKIDVPSTAAKDTPWRVTRQSKQNYYNPLKPVRNSFDERGPVGYYRDVEYIYREPGSDVTALFHDRVVSVTPLSLDLTSRISLPDFEAQLRASD